MTFVIVVGTSAVAPAREVPGAAQARCRIVIKIVRGKKKRVRVCRKSKPKSPSLPQAGSVVATISIGAGVVSVAAGDESVWITTDDRRLLRVDPATNKVAASLTLPESEWPENVAYGNGAAWVAVASLDTVAKPELDSLLRVDPGTNQVIARIPVGHSPEGITFTPGAVWTANHRSDSPPEAPKPSGTYSVSRIDTSSNSEVARVAVESRQRADAWSQFCCGPQGMTAGAGSVWTGDPTEAPRAGSVIRIDPVTNTVAASIPLTAPVYGTADACGGMAGNDEAIWIANGCGDSTVTRIDPHSNKVAATVDLGPGTSDVALGFGSLWASSDTGIARIDPATNKVVARTPVPTSGVPPAQIAIAAGSIWITSGPNLIRIKPA